MSKKLKTINLQGKEYAKVAERLRAVHEDHKDFDIVNSYEVTPAGAVVFTATLTIRDKKDAKNVVTYTGHSYGKLGAAKAFEKQETIAVGRALAFAGYHADGEIASVDEMADYEQSVDTEAVQSAISAIDATKDLNGLKKVYDAMPPAIKRSKQVLEAGKKKKQDLTTIE
jgi:hypothetical protein